MNESLRPPRWYKDAVIYQLHVRSFCDSNADGIGDFDGATSKLDYLVDLGVDTIWVQPFFPSPLRDDGYDISDYTSVNPVYGDLTSFQRFLDEAHQRGIRVIIELVMNHTSDQHEWFQRARRAPIGSSERDFYVWSDTPDRYPEARIIFQDYETSNWAWDPVAGQYYWHRFYSHQPDLNFENPAVRRTILDVLDMWFEMGADGVRLDAIPYLFEAEGTNCENLPETHAFLKELRAHMDARYGDRLLLAEANQWPEDAVEYFGRGDECHMAFHFPLMPRLYMALQMESRTPIIDILDQTPDIPDSCQWAMFLRNHDELTLEMVTDEERDYMRRHYAADPRMRVNLGIRRRLAPLMQDDRRKVELMNALLLSMPGTPVIYYGDEIGMGDNVYLGDRDAVRTPMQWSDDRNAGFSRCNPQQLFLPTIIDPEHHYEAVNVEAQRRNPSSLWWTMRRLIGLRRRHQVFGRGRMDFVDSDNAKVLSFVRSIEADEANEGRRSGVLVIANLSRHPQQVTLASHGPLFDYVGVTPVEMFGQTQFAPIGDQPYTLSIGPHGFYWFSLSPIAEREEHTGARLPSLSIPFTRSQAAAVGAALPAYLRTQRWYGDRDRTITDAGLADTIVYPDPAGERHIVAAIERLEFVEGESQHYFVPMSIDEPSGAATIAAIGNGELALQEAFVDTSFAARLICQIATGEKVQGLNGALVGRPLAIDPALRQELSATDPETIAPLGAEQSNSSFVSGSHVLKVLRRIESGVHPEAEMLAHLAAQGFPNIAPLAGTIAYRPAMGQETTVATLVGYVQSDGDAWRLMLAEAARFYDWALAHPQGPELGDVPPSELVEYEVPDQLVEPLHETLQFADLLGRRTGEMHIALSRGDAPRMVPEPFTRLYQRSMYQGLRTELRSTMGMLRRHPAALAEAGTTVEELAHLESSVLDQYAQLNGGLIDCLRIRVHGDLHLGQILERGGDVTFIDFEGEPARPLGERSIKRNALVDVAGMVRSFDYAAHQAVIETIERGSGTSELLLPWARVWSSWTANRFVLGYLDAIAGTALVPDDLHHRRLLLDVFLLQKAVYELRYELGHRPDWLALPLHALLRWRSSRRSATPG